MTRSKAWVARYVSNIVADTQDLNIEEFGAYNRLLDHHFLRDSIPKDTKRMSIILGVSPQKTRKLWQVLSHFFYEKDGAFYQKRMVKEITKAIEISEKRKISGAKGGRAFALAIAQGKTETTTTTTTKRKKHTTSTATRFDDWWSVVWKKVEKKKASDIWKRRKLDNLADQIIADTIKRQKEDGKWLAGYAPNPTTYLNGDRWDDELEAPRTNGSKPMSDAELLAIAHDRGISTVGLTHAQLKAQVGGLA